MGDAAFQALVLQNVHDMVVRDRNRPSVIVWATRLNETANYTSLYAQARQLAYTLDGTRQTTGAMTNQSTTGWAEDVFAYDNYDSSNGNATIRPPVPGVPYIVSEAVGALDGAPLYRWVDTEATLAIQCKMHAQVHDIAQSNTAYAGLLGLGGHRLRVAQRRQPHLAQRSNGPGCSTRSVSPSPARRSTALR